ncbi:MAG: hypothetical protein ABIV48_03265 [Pyrinomonadaceae bacterium]
MSNQVKFYLLIAGFAVVFQACSSTASNENKALITLAETKSEFPFTTREPQTYQGEFVVTDGAIERKWFIARNGEKRRFDVFRGDQSFVGEIQAGERFLVNYEKKIFAAPPAGETSGLNIDDLTKSLFSGKDYREFDDLGRDGELRKYKIRKDEITKDDIVIYVNEALGMIVKQEFVSQGDGSGSPVKIAYEIRDLKLEPDDRVFKIPDGFKKVAWSEYRQYLNK